MKYPVKVDHKEKAIIMSCAFAKKSAFPNMAEYHELETLHNTFPNYKIKTRKIKLNSQKEAFNGLTYAYMEEYIPKHDNADINMKKYLEMRELARCQEYYAPIAFEE